MAFDKEKILALMRKNPVGFACGLAGVILISAAYFRSDAVPEAATELEAKSAEADRLAANIKHSAQLKEQVELLTTVAKQIDTTRLVRASELATNLQYFYRLEAETSVKLLELRQNQVLPAKEKKGSFIAVPFTVGAQGDYPHLLEFLRRLEGGTHYCRVLSATLAAAVGGGGEEAAGGGLLTINLQIELLGLP